MMENVFIDTKNRSYTIIADLELPQKPVEGVILCQQVDSAAGAFIPRMESCVSVTTGSACSGIRFPPINR